MSFGANLKRERELRGITLDEISKATKVSVRLLKAIEADQFDILPEGVFRKSFIKSYAKYLGMNEEQVLHEYALQHAARAAAPPQQEKLLRSRAFITPPSPSSKVIWITAGSLALVGLILYWLLHNSGRTPTQDSVPKTGTRNSPLGESTASGFPETNQHAPKPALSPASGSVEPESHQKQNNGAQSPLRVLGELAKTPDHKSIQEVASTTTGHQLVVHAVQPTWLSVSSDKELMFAGLMTARESKTLSLESPLKIVVGNAAGVSLAVNGQSLRRLGNEDERVTLEISKDNYQKYLEKKPQ